MSPEISNAPTEIAEPAALLPPQTTLTQSLLDIPAFLDERQDIAMTTPEQLNPQTIATRRSIHIGLLRLVARERLRERRTVQDTLLRTDGDTTSISAEWTHEWNSNWSLTPERRAHIIAKYPHRIYAAAQSVMRAINTERMQDGEFAPDTELIPYSAVVEGHEGQDQSRLARHLGRAGYYDNWRRRGNPMPIDAASYLTAYPLPDFRTSHDWSLADIAKETSVGTRRTMEDIVEGLRLYPALRMGGGDRRAGAYFDATARAKIHAELDKMPPIDDTSIRLKMLQYDLPNKRLRRIAQQLANIPTQLRRLPNGSRVQCIPADEEFRLCTTYSILAQLQETGLGTHTYSPHMLKQVMASEQVDG